MLGVPQGGSANLVQQRGSHRGAQSLVPKGNPTRGDPKGISKRCPPKEVPQGGSTKGVLRVGPPRWNYKRDPARRPPKWGSARVVQ